MSEQQKLLKDFTPEERAEIEKFLGENGNEVFECMLHFEEQFEALRQSGGER